MADVTTVEQTVHRLPAPVRWALWLVAAALASVFVGFLIGLARPRRPGVTGGWTV